MKKHLPQCDICLTTKQYGYTNDPDPNHFKVKLFTEDKTHSKESETLCPIGKQMNAEMDDVFKIISQN